jgi:hypothetical protein
MSKSCGILKGGKDRRDWMQYRSPALSNKKTDHEFDKTDGIREYHLLLVVPTL